MATNVMTQDGFRVADTYRTAQEKGHIGQAVNEAMQAATAAATYIDGVAAEARASIPSGLTCINETDWAQTTPADNHIYLVFPDEESES